MTTDDKLIQYFWIGVLSIIFLMFFLCLPGPLVLVNHLCGLGDRKFPWLGDWYVLVIAFSPLSILGVGLVALCRLSVIRALLASVLFMAGILSGMQLIFFLGDSWTVVGWDLGGIALFIGIITLGLKLLASRSET
jgi:hypothetical protein